MAIIASVVIAPRHNLLSHESSGFEIGPYRQGAVQDRLEGEGSGTDLEQTRSTGEPLALPLGAHGLEGFGWNRVKMQSPSLPKNTFDG